MKARVPSLIGGQLKWFCPTCHRWLLSLHFYPSNRTPSGLSSQCRKCHNEGAVRTRDKDRHRDERRESMRRARAINPEKFRARERVASRLRTKDERTDARAALNAAVRKGEILRPTICSACMEPRKVTAHHPDYSRPLDVVWLCYECHGKEHRNG